MVENSSPRARRLSSIPARFWALTAIIVGAALFRVLPHPPNFTPMTGLALFGGACMISPRARATKLWALFVPLAALFISDLCLGFYPEMPVVYASMALITLMGFALRENQSVLRVAGVTLSASLVFFVLTNFGTWALTDFYPHTTSGLVGCYVAGVPFLRNSLASDFISTGALFGLWAFLKSAVPSFTTEAA